MSTDWLNEIIRENQLTKEDKKLINEAFGYYQTLLQKHPEVPTVRKTGSQAKKIAVHSKFDLDILVQIPSDNKMTLQQFYNSVYKYLKQKGQSPQQKDVAISCTWRNKKIDIVPSKEIDENFFNVWRSRSSIKRRTSLIKQIEEIDRFGARNLFKLIKLWKIKQKLKGPSFLYEIYTIRAIDAMEQKIWETDHLGYITIEIFNYIYKTANDIKIVDLTNSNNHISDLWDEKERKRVKDAASLALQILEDDDEDYSMIF